MELDVYLEAIQAPIGTLTRAEDGAISFAYTTDALPHPVSLSLPVREAPYDDVASRAFFANLLFENAQRDQVMQRHGIGMSDIVGLLYHLGRDCPGAISVVPKGHDPGKRPGTLARDYTRLSADDLAHLMRALQDHRRLPAETDDPSPLAGVQGKLALTRLEDGTLALPRTGSGAPTTHILKVPRANEMRLVDHEHILMSDAARILTHPVAKTEIIEGDVRGLLVTRFDRLVDDGAVHRLHQEDFCQALGLGPDLKYQRNGGPAGRFDAAAIGRVLDQCQRPGPARQAMIEGTVINLLFGNTDNHAKNHALIYRAERPDLAPFYDIVPILADPTVTHQMSFDIGAATMVQDITAADLDRFAAALGGRRITPAQRKRLTDIVAACVDLMGGYAGPARKRLGDVIATQAPALVQALGADMDVPVRDLVLINHP